MASIFHVASSIAWLDSVTNYYVMCWVNGLRPMGDVILVRIGGSSSVDSFAGCQRRYPDGSLDISMI